jgi:hypothetical protein
MAPRLALRMSSPLRSSLLALLALGSPCLTLIGPSPAPAQAAVTEGPGAKGAQVYCFMRNNGNGHQVSWTAAYALIKRQSASMFKTSPEHAAVMITEAVVNNPGTYPDCGRYLGELYRRSQPGATAVESAPAASPGGRAEVGSTMTRSERYSSN